MFTSKTVFAKTPKGFEMMRNPRQIKMPREIGVVFLDVDGKRTFADLMQKRSLDESGLTSILDKLVAEDYIKVFPQPAASSRVLPGPSSREAAANARTEADARARAEAKARPRAEEESRAREGAEAQLRAMEARLRHAEAARTEAEAQTEAERQLREDALKEAQQEMEARLEKERRLRAEAIRKAREEAEARARAEVETTIQAERKAREEAEFRLQIERQAREEAERKSEAEIRARLQTERAARAEAEAKAAEVATATAAAAQLMREAASKSDSDAIQLRKEADKVAGTARRAHADAIARAQAEMMARVRAEQEAMAEKRTLTVAQDRAEEEAIALANRERAARVRAEQEAMAKVEAEMKAREQAEMEADARARAEAEQRAQARAAQIMAERTAARGAAALARPPVPWGRIATLGTTALIAVVVLLLHVVPFPVAGTEKLLSDRLQEPVRIGSLHLEVYPSLRWKLGRITIGKGEDIKIGAASAAATPMGSSGTKHLDEVQLSSVTIDQDAFPRMAAWVKPQAANHSLHVDNLRVSAVTLSIGDLKLPTFDAAIALAADGTLKNVILHEPRLSVELTPVKGGEWTGKFKGRGWRPPVADGLEFSDLGGEVSILPGQVAVSGIAGTLYNGSIKGEVIVKWGSQINAEGQFNLTGVDLGQLLPVMASGFSASGSLDSKMRFTSQGLRPIELLGAPRVTATFSVRKGLLNNVDLGRALQSSSRGGKTPFDEITGDVQVTANRFIYRSISLTSAALKASGAIDVSPNAELSGRINVLVGTQAVTATRGTLNVSGSLRNPVLSP